MLGAVGARTTDPAGTTVVLQTGEDGVGSCQRGGASWVYGPDGTHEASVIFGGCTLGAAGLVWGRERA